MLCNRLHAWWLTQSRLITLLPSLIARRHNEGSDKNVKWKAKAHVGHCSMLTAKAV